MTGKKRSSGRPQVPEITESQKQALKELQDFIACHKYPPTMSELGKRLGVAAPSAYQLVLQLERKGYVSRESRKARSLSIVRQVEDTPEKLVPVPLLGIVAAGPALLAEENHLGDILVDQSIAGRGRCFALRVSGESMKGAGMHDGDVIMPSSRLSETIKRRYQGIFSSTLGRNSSSPTSTTRSSDCSSRTSSESRPQPVTARRKKIGHSCG